MNTTYDTPETPVAPAWPIRVGGMHRALGGTTHSPEPLDMHLRVTAIDGDTIHYEFAHPSGVTTPRPPSPAHCFRHLCLPEDESPLPGLYALLEPLANTLSLAEWDSPEHAETILRDIITRYHPLLTAALRDKERNVHAG